MAQRFVCDGCGALIEHEPTKIGFVVRPDYCDACAKNAMEYMADIDKLHTDLSGRWTKGLADTRAKWAKKLQKLPDTGPKA